MVANRTESSLVSEEKGEQDEDSILLELNARGLLTRERWCFEVSR